MWLIPQMPSPPNFPVPRRQVMFILSRWMGCDWWRIRNGAGHRQGQAKEIFLPWLQWSIRTKTLTVLFTALTTATNTDELVYYGGLKLGNFLSSPFYRCLVSGGRGEEAFKDLDMFRYLGGIPTKLILTIWGLNVFAQVTNVQTRYSSKEHPL